jgi:hypothetical protein
MTLIVSAQTNYLVMLSDIVTSRDGRHDALVSGLPLTPRPIRVASDNHTLIGLAQKAVQFDDRHVLLWAGSEIVARHVWTGLAQAVLAEPATRLLDFVASLDLPDAEKGQVALVYHRLDPDGRFFREAFNAKRADIDGVDTFFAGTGDFHFIDDIRPIFATPDSNSYNSLLRDWLHRIGYVILSEAIDGENLEYAYGGWFEIVLYEDGRFKKIPYLIKLWEEREGIIKSAPCISGWYKDNHLCLLRSHVRKTASESSNDVTVVRDPLRRTAIENDRRNVIESYTKGALQIHLVFNEQRRWAIVLKSGDTADYAFDINNGQITTGWSGALRLELLGALAGPTNGRIDRPFSEAR